MTVHRPELVYCTPVAAQKMFTIPTHIAFTAVAHPPWCWIPASKYLRTIRTFLTTSAIINNRRVLNNSTSHHIEQDSYRMKPPPTSFLYMAWTDHTSMILLHRHLNTHNASERHVFVFINGSQCLYAVFLTCTESPSLSTCMIQSGWFLIFLCSRVWFWMACIDEDIECDVGEHIDGQTLPATDGIHHWTN